MVPSRLTFFVLLRDLNHENICPLYGLYRDLTVAEPLDYAYEMKVVRLDVKPQNVIFRHRLQLRKMSPFLGIKRIRRLPSFKGSRTPQNSRVVWEAVT